MDKDAVLSFVDICTGKAKLTREARCILSAYNRTISNWGGSSGVFYGCRAVVTPDREEKRQNGRRIKNCGEPSFTVTAQDRHGVLFQDCDECPYGMQIREATKKGYDLARCGDSINLSFPESKTRRGRVGKDLATTLETSCNQGTAFAGCGLIRRLTPRECWRLQGFTDEMFDKARAVNSDNQLYGDIVESRKKNGTPILKTTGVSRSGCMYCMYGVHLEHEPNRFQLMQVTHPQQYDYCINKLGCGAVLDYIGVPYRNQQLEVDHC